MRLTINGLIKMSLGVQLLLGAGPLYATEPALIQAKYEQCLDWMQAEQYPQATGCFEAVLALDADSKNSLFYLGKLYGQNKQYQQSIQKFEQVLAIDPGDFWAIHYLLPSLDGAGLTARSLMLAQQAAIDFPQHAGFWAYLIRRYQQDNQLDKVQQARRQLLALVEQRQFDGLSSENMYLRDIFQVADTTIYGIEYFKSSPDAPQIFSFRAKFANGQERNYRVTYNKFMENLVQQEQGGQARPYFFDAFDGQLQRLIAPLLSEPSYEQLKQFVLQDLAGQPVKRVCVDGPTSVQVVPCP